MDETKLLGVIIDNYLTWNSHINQTTTKVAKNIGIINKVTHFILNENIKTLYYSLVFNFHIYIPAMWRGLVRTPLT